RPSAVTATPFTQSVCPSRVRRACATARSQTFSVRSREADTAKRPSAVTATPFTQSVCPSRVRTACPVARSQTFSVLSPQPPLPPGSRPRHAVHPTHIPFAGADGSPRGHTPALHSFPPGGGPGEAPIRRHRHAGHPRGMPFEGADGLPADGVPHLQRLVV